jgi:hypothetical protein
MASYHDQAMEAKAKGEEKEYRKNLGTAEKLLKDRERERREEDARDRNS